MAAGSTYTPIATTTLTSAQTGITFTGISSAYTDLILVLRLISLGGGALRYQVGNGSIDTGANYSATFLTGSGSAASSDRTSNANFVNILRLTGTGTSPATHIFQFQNYSNTTTYKTILGRTSQSQYEVGANVGLWRSTSAINQIYIYESVSSNMNTGTTATLYGIAAA
jgi:hypothetical protein